MEDSAGWKEVCEKKFGEKRVMGKVLPAFEKPTIELFPPFQELSKHLC